MQLIKGHLLAVMPCFGLLQGTQSISVLTNFVAVQAAKKETGSF